MSKKDKTSALIASFMGGGEAYTETPAPAPQADNEDKTPTNIKTDLPEPTIEELGLSQDLVEALNRERRKNVGRGKKQRTDLRSSKEYGCMYGDIRATFILKQELVTKLKYISLVETRTIKSLLSEVLGEYVSKWEEENGAINIKKKDQ